MNVVMKKVLWGAAIGAGTGLSVDLFNKQKKQSKYTFIPDRDMRNSKTLDDIESVDAPFDHSEIGLTQLDSAYRDEWQGMGYPQTHKEIEENKNSLAEPIKKRS